MIPFLACPELLCIDRERHVHDGYEYPDIFGLKALQKEPSGTASSASLKDRASRRASLDEYIGYYAVNGPDELRDALTTLLRRAAERLGSPDAQSDLGDPVFMVVHALNLADPTNWPEVTVKLRDGSLTTACQYVPPQSEAEHLKPIQDAQQERQTDTNMQMALSLILDNPSRSSPELAAEAVNWAQGFGTKIQVNDEDGQKLREEAIYVAALVAVRDGNTELRAQHATWIRNTFARAMRTKDDPVHWVRDGLHFNPIAIAFVGMTFLLKDRATRTDLRAILKAAARENPAAAHGFAVTADALATIDERLPRAVMRCALAARIRPSRSAWDEPKKKAAGRAKQHRQRVKAAIDAELAWLDSKRAEPDWPQLPLEPARPKHRLRIPSGKQQHKEPAREYVHPDEYFEHQGGALWIRSAAKLYDVVKRPWLRDIARNYSAWTMTANGAGLDSNDDVAHPPREWDDAYFSLLAYCLPELDSAGIDELALAPIVSLPDESFFDAIAVFLRSIDEIHFNDKGLQEAQALHIRAALARRMMASRGWYWLARNRSYNIEIHIGPALAALFFNDYMMREAKCYLLQKGVDRVASFLPILQEMVTEGPCLFLALVTLNLVEVSPRPTHLPFMVAAGKTWLAGYPEDNTFWIDHGIGRRLCLWISAVLNLDRSTLAGNAVLRGDTEHLLAGLVRVGVSEARRLEEMLGLV